MKRRKPVKDHAITQGTTLKRVYAEDLSTLTFAKDLANPKFRYTKQGPQRIH